MIHKIICAIRQILEYIEERDDQRLMAANRLLDEAEEELKRLNEIST